MIRNRFHRSGSTAAGEGSTDSSDDVETTMSAAQTAHLAITDDATSPSPLARMLARVRTPALKVLLTMWAVLIVLGLIEPWTSSRVQTTQSLLSLAFLLLVITVMVMLRFGSGRRPAARRIAPPMTGRWMAVATPAHRVPSHGTHQFGQTYAIDMCADPIEHARPRFGGFGWTRPASDFPGFGATILSSARATVIHVDDGQRDHRARNTWATLPLLIADGIVRGLLSYRYVFGNHIVLDLGDGTYLTYAHLQRDSITVTVGDHVDVGQVIAACGNSGNSSEPHLHLQLMDRPKPTRAAGLPFAFTHTTLEGPAGQRGDHAVVPGREQTFTAALSVSSSPSDLPKASQTAPQHENRPLFFTPSS